MVTRVDKKPIVYNTCLLRVIRPSVVSQRKAFLESILEKCVGYAVTKASARDIIDDYEDIEGCLRTYGINDPAFVFSNEYLEDDEREAADIARSMVRTDDSIRRALRSAATMEEVTKMHMALMSDVDKIYTGTEAVYALLSEIRMGNVMKPEGQIGVKSWVAGTTLKALNIQAPYLFIHPSAVSDMASETLKAFNDYLWPEWDMYKGVETLALRVFSRRNLHAHAAIYGINKKGFEPSPVPLDDFEIPLHSSMQAAESLKVYAILGIKYVKLGSSLFCLTADDCINLASMAQCFFRNAMYFTPGNGYTPSDHRASKAAVDEILLHCRKLIDSRKNFANAIRSLHILAQGDFNDMYEKEMGTDLGWRERSANYVEEARALDPVAQLFHRKIMAIARTKFDELNVGFMYHCFIGDEMLISDLRGKVKAMPTKVLGADENEWSRFISFCKTYFICRFMMVHKRKPKAAGDVKLLNDQWAERCVKGHFTMPPQSDWGKVWISKEFTYTKFADTWHLDAQDVSYVVKDAEGFVEGKYNSNRLIHSELLMAMTSGNVLDILTGSTPKTARERIHRGEPCKQVAVTTAPKAENAKPSWKKRVTFAADCEFRKMQAEYDRNCRKVMGFVRGPSLGIDQVILEKQFADIAQATQAGVSGGICSHDISAWSESMDRGRKFEFEQVLLDMLNAPSMTNIKLDWGKIQAIVSKQGNKEVIPLDNGSFQGFDGSASTILHSMILLYCIDSARRANIMDASIKANMATLIDDCIALMRGLTSATTANDFWAHLKATYRKLGFEVDDLKSIFSTIKAIYLSRRFLCGAEVPADYKVFVKAHVSYEDPLRCSMDAISDIFGAMRGACDANGNAWFIYTSAVFSSLAEIAYHNPEVMNIPPSAACVFALAPSIENGWGVPSILDWSTNDVTDKRAHFNAIMENAANYTLSGKRFTRGYDVFDRLTGTALVAIKSQAWRLVSVSNIFTNPFEAVREGPLKPDMLKRNAVQDILRETATAEPWKSLLEWNVSLTTERVRAMLISSGPLHAPTLSALVNCMPDNYRLSLVGKAIGSQSLLDLLPKGQRSNLKRRVTKCSRAFFHYTVSIYKSTNDEYSASDFSAMNYLERTQIERDEFYALNGCDIIDHTFPDPLATFTNSRVDLGSFMCPNMTSIIEWNRVTLDKGQTKDYFAPRGVYVPRRSGRVWEITSEYAKGWDTVSQRIAMGLAILARAAADGHGIDGLLNYFVRAWNELSNITPHDTHLISIHGSIKRLDSNPGSSTHPIIVHRNILRGINFRIKTAIDAIPCEIERREGTTHHLHDPLSHETSVLAATALQLACFIQLGVEDNSVRHTIATRPDCLVAESQKRMDTNVVADKIALEIMESEDNYGLLQSCPELAEQIAIPTMKSSWVKMISALIDGDQKVVEELREKAMATPVEELVSSLREEEAIYTTSVVLAAEPASRSSIPAKQKDKYALVPAREAPRSQGDGYTMSVRPVGSKFSRALAQEQPDYLTSAVIIRSICWDRLKSKSLMALSSIFYDDPECNLSVLSECSTKSFWKAIAVEVSRIRKRKPTSELLMQGFRSLGVPGLHITPTEDVDELSHAMASYFGAHLRVVVRIIGDQIVAIAGRKASDFEKPFLERVITNNPTLQNIKIRKAHIDNLVKYNMEHLASRIEAILLKDIKHRGDKRACRNDIDAHGRLVELRCRRYVYSSTKTNEKGEAEIDMPRLANIIRKAATSVGARFEINDDEIPQVNETFRGVLRFMDNVYDIFAADNRTKGKKHGWDPHSGSIGARYAYDTIISDSKQIAATRFAVSAAEIAPRLFKKIVVSNPEPAKPAFEEEDDDDWDDPFEMEEFGAEDTMISLSGVGASGASGLFKVELPKASVEEWQMLYTLLYTNVYTAADAARKLGIIIPRNPSPSDLREARLDTVDSDVINDAYSNLVGDYLNAGVVFDSEWLERDEADAYTVDEISKVLKAALF